MLCLSKPRYVQLFAFSIFVFGFTIYYLAPVSTATISPYLQPTYLLRSKPKHVNIEMEGLLMGKPFLGLEDMQDRDAKLQKLGEDLLARYKALDVNTDHPNCPIDLARYSSVMKTSGRSNTKERVSIALNLFNSQDILPSLSLALLETVHHLQPGHEIYLSIFENDSTDKTMELLGDLAAALVALQVDGLVFRHSQLTKKDGVERIVGLSNMRNEALYPLFSTAADGVLLFVNDVVTCGSDLLELVNQIRLQNAHGAMSTDWFINRDDNKEQPQFRDTWVMRGINGEMPYLFKDPGGYTPMAPTGNWVRDLFLSQDEALHQRWVDGRPVPVYSGWNGAMAFDASIFTELHVRFRASGKAKWIGGDASGALGPWGQLVATPGYLETDCGASECKLFARDVWNVLKGEARIFVAPQSRTGYTLDDYNIIAAQAPATRRTGLEGPEELIDWGNVSMPHGVVCVPAVGDDGNFIDPWGVTNIRAKKDPRMAGWA